ncbi:shikimate kinase [Liquorilactobacillus hordei]|uniref:DNA topology modulation protein n=1 Tax=Liquorilactobacillus hordei DSM 19519 TaxID=1423759 RepID=A0A0R1MQX7_9LACO|nr:shikimate kinase [Liquorilactobacillus hordei]KRL08132.1 DNA topology modulation protein [Liquorilactobacillus hordei DSM 19519]MBZ2406504.1 topology modulation protein [Liquorilactobacillus hordei]QYH51789.1 ATP-binding cassette domain-containing protein [Liquorilactobacillus hordei DSM 19519]
MKIIIIGNCGSGKSTLSKQIAAQLNYPLLQLDNLWHQTNYSTDAKEWFIQKQIKFMQQDNWIIDGNYRSTMSLRLQQADVIIWLKISKFRAIWRIIKRSILFRINKKTRPEMPEQFKEHFDREYLEFLKFVFSYDEKQISEVIKVNRTDQSNLVIVRKKADKKKIVNLIENEYQIV